MPGTNWADAYDLGVVTLWPSFVAVLTALAAASPLLAFRIAPLIASLIMRGTNWNSSNTSA